jgi:hypothetical protein
MAYFILSCAERFICRNTEQGNKTIRPMIFILKIFASNLGQQNATLTDFQEVPKPLTNESSILR